MPVLLLLLIGGVAEIAVLVALGNAIGVLPTIGLLLASAALGVWLLRREAADWQIYPAESCCRIRSSELISNVIPPIFMDKLGASASQSTM